MIDREPRTIDPRELGVIENSQIGQTRIEVLRDRKGRIRWSYLFKKDPEKLSDFIMQEAVNFYNQHDEIGIRSLEREGNFQLIHAIQRYRPGGMRSIIEIVNVVPVLSGVTRDKRGRVRWKLPGNTPEENEQLGIRNMQGLFLERFPEFTILFPRDKAGLIQATLVDGARSYILDRVGTTKNFKAIFGSSILRSSSVSCFNGSFVTSLRKSFRPWGIQFKIKDFIGEKIWEGKTKEQICDAVREIFLEEYPEFGIRFLRGEEDKIPSDQLTDAKNFILEKIPSGKASIRLFGAAYKGHPSFNLSSINLIQRAFESWGVKLQTDYRQTVPPEESLQNHKDMLSRKTRKRRADVSSSEVSQSIYYASSKEGLVALDKFLAGKSDYTDLSPFTLPVIYRKHEDKNPFIFDYYIGAQTGVPIFLRFYLTEEQVSALGKTLYVVPHQQSFGEQNTYCWLDLHIAPEAGSPILRSCRLRSGEEKHEIAFRTWHGLEEQLLADYVLGIGSLKFSDLLPFNLIDIKKSHMKAYQIAGVNGLSVKIVNENLQDGDTLRFVPKTDDQRLYEWVDILKVIPTLPEEKWPLISSYRLVLDEHRIYSQSWFGLERKLLLDRMQGRSGVQFTNLKPIVASATSNGRIVPLFALRSSKIHSEFRIKPNLLVQGEKTIAIPKQDDQGIYEWFELYRFDLLTSTPFGDLLDSARITPEGLRYWVGLEKQLLKDYMGGLVRFDQLKTITCKKSQSGLNTLLLWSEGKKDVYLIPSESFNLKPGEVLTLVPEKETGEGAEFLLVRAMTPLARYRLDLKTMRFRLLENLQKKDKPEIADSAEANDYLRELVYGEDKI